MLSGTDLHMTEATGSQTFEEIVKWAYSTLPQKIKELPDFPGIQIAEEPPVDVLKKIREKRNWPVRREMLGLYSGIHRTEPQHFLQRIAPDLIFVFRGPILRCSKGDLRAEVKQVVWHEVAHWLGHDEEEVQELGLSLGDAGATPGRPKSEAPITVSQLRHDDETEQSVNEQLRSIKCYSTNVTCREVDKPASYAGAKVFDPIIVHARICTCDSCGFKWDDEDSG
jgi:predicted Zn-dependent protease with MMP-like domain